MFKSAQFYFHGCLNDFLPKTERNKVVPYRFADNPSVKHAIETIGTPHTEVHLILVNGIRGNFSYRIQDHDEIEIYPHNEPEKATGVGVAEPSHAEVQGFIADVHLGKLAKMLRLFGFDTLYNNSYTDKLIIETAGAEEKIILTRDRNLLKHKAVGSGYWVRSQNPEEQFTEVIERFRLGATLEPFKRCIECNGEIKKVEKADIWNRLLPKTRLYYNDFFECCSCKRIYWKGSHYFQINSFIKRVREKIKTF